MNGRRTILLAGEGACTILHDLLSSSSCTVRALTRNEVRAEVLRQLGVEVFDGDVDDCASLRRAMHGCWGVFAATASVMDGRNVIKVAAGADVEQLVFAASTEEELEAYARGLGLPATFVDAGSTAGVASMFLADMDEPYWPRFSLQLFP